MQSFSLREVGLKLNITAQSVKEIEDRELTGSVTVKVLQKFGEALGYKFEYRFTKNK